MTPSKERSFIGQTTMQTDEERASELGFVNLDAYQNWCEFQRANNDDQRIRKLQMSHFNLLERLKAIEAQLALLKKDSDNGTKT